MTKKLINNNEKGIYEWCNDEKLITWCYNEIKWLVLRDSVKHNLRSCGLKEKWVQGKDDIMSGWDWLEGTVQPVRACNGWQIFRW
jgi:hypothetical protein